MRIVLGKGEFALYGIVGIGSVGKCGNSRYVHFTFTVYLYLEIIERVYK
jgi:hypothetical protein